MSKQLANVPALRFEEFSGEWEVHRIKNITTKVGSGSTPRGGSQVYSNSGIPFIRSQNVNNDILTLDDATFISETINSTMKGSEIKPLDVLLNITGASLGRSCTVPSTFEKGNLNQHVCIIRLKKQFQPYFLQRILASDIGQKQILLSATGSGREGLNFESIKQFQFPFPTLPEQEKIADFLSAVDEKIQQLTRKKELLEQYKKGVMQQLFSQQLRFQDDNGRDFPEWEEKRLGEVGARITTKNKDNEVNFVLTNSATQGIVSQSDYFDKDIANQNNLEGYYIVRVNDFIYNPRISVTAPVGPIKRNKLGLGVMSPLYTVFRFNRGNLAFMELFFQTHYWHEYLKSVSNHGARHDRMNIVVSDFMTMPIPFPTLPEQEKIADFLSAVDDKINQIGTQQAAAKAFKKGLLQQMFV